MVEVDPRTTFCDPIHRILDFGTKRPDRQLVKDLVDSRPFQRLRRISQLGLAAHVFPCATHTRFAHCLGVAHLARIVTQQLIESHIHRRDELSDHSRLLVAAGLLHDVGHGPFSHAFERALESILGTRIDHEAWTRAIVRGPLQSTLRSHGIDPDVLAEMYFEASIAVPAYLKQVVSSQLDVDRMDYLVRDAHFSGVPIGQIDLHYLIKNLAIVEHGAGHATLGLSRKGVKSYEGFALARHMMNRTVYYHAKVAALELLMEEALTELVQGIRQGNDTTGVPPCIRGLATASFSNAESFIDANLSNYLSLTEDHVWTALAYIESDWTGRANDLANRLLSRKVPKYFRVEQGKRGDLDRVLKEDGLTDRDFKIRLTKSTVYRQDEIQGAVHVVNDDGTNSEITHHSLALRLYEGRPESESILVVLDESKTERISAVSEQCIVSRAPRARVMKPLAKVHPSDSPASPDSTQLHRLRQALWLLESVSDGPDGLMIELGTGFATERGILTCDHVISANTVVFHCTDLDAKSPVKIIHRCKNRDLALLELPRSSGTLQLAAPKIPNLHDELLAVGFPNPSVGDSGRFTKVRVSGYRQWFGYQRIQVDVPFVAGMSGGPVLDSQEQVVGVISHGSSSLTAGPFTEMHAFIPSNAVKDFMLEAEGLSAETA